MLSRDHTHAVQVHRSGSVSVLPRSTPTPSTTTATPRFAATPTATATATATPTSSHGDHLARILSRRKNRLGGPGDSSSTPSSSSSGGGGGSSSSSSSNSGAARTCTSTPAAQPSYPAAHGYRGPPSPGRLEIERSVGRAGRDALGRRRRQAGEPRGAGGGGGGGRGGRGGGEPFATARGGAAANWPAGAQPLASTLAAAAAAPDAYSATAASSAPSTVHVHRTGSVSVTTGGGGGGGGGGGVSGSTHGAYVPAWGEQRGGGGGGWEEDGSSSARQPHRRQHNSGPASHAPPSHTPPRSGHTSDGSGRAYGDLSRFEPRLTDWLRCDQLPGPRRRMCAPLRITGDAAACNRVNAMITPIVDEYRSEVFLTTVISVFFIPWYSELVTLHTDAIFHTVTGHLPH